MVHARSLRTLFQFFLLSWLLGLVAMWFLMRSSCMKEDFTKYSKNLNEKNHLRIKVEEHQDKYEIHGAKQHSSKHKFSHQQGDLALPMFENENFTKNGSLTVINPHPYKFIINQMEICTKARHKDIFLLIIVHTHPANYERRMHIRATWGNQRLYPHVKAVTVFAMGWPMGSPKLQKTVLRESRMYQDVIQEDFADTYKNLSLKAVMWLKWAATYCPQVPYLVKVDDDIVVNIFNLATHLANLYNRNVTCQKTILCLVWNNMPVLRQNNSRWFVSQEEVVNDTYPRYCSGSAYILTSDLVPQLYRKSFHTKFVWVDDAYITGFVPIGLDFVHLDISSLYVLRHEEIEEKLANGYALFGHSPTSIESRKKSWETILAVRNITGWNK